MNYLARFETITFTSIVLVTLTGATPSVAPDVASVISAGCWENGSTRGIYRVVLWDGGYEHVTTGAVAEWVAGPNDNDSDSSVVKSHVLVEPGLFSLGPPKLTARNGRLRVALSGTRSTDPKISISCVFELYPRGTVKTVKPCG